MKERGRSSISWLDDLGVSPLPGRGDGRVGVGPRMEINRGVGVLPVRAPRALVVVVAVFTVFRVHARRQAEGSAAGHPSARRVWGAW
ncbi:MAG: hypothetical protein QOH97_2494 [Actinoplanes sp.]|jgi:hypothetical protein|nr:hypothetical protein [Actinoplanes sp.]